MILQRLFSFIFIFLVAASSYAAVYTYNLNTTFSGTPPSGPAPWMTVSFADVGFNQVQMNISTNGLTGSEFVGGLYANYKPALNPSLLGFTSLNPLITTSTTVSGGTNQFKADGGGYYDIFFDFPQNKNARIGADLNFAYLITSSDVIPVNASLFDFLSSPSGGNGTWAIAAHIQSIGNGKSAWIGSSGNITVPEPSTYLMLASLLGLVMLAAYVRGGRTETNCSSSK